MQRFSRTRISIVAGLIMVGLVALVVGIQFASHKASAGPARNASPTASPFPGQILSTTKLVAGRYVTSDPFPIPVSVTVPAGWKSEVAGPNAVFLSTSDGHGSSGPAVLSLLLSPLVYADPCKYQHPSSPVTSVDEFVKAVTALRGLTVTGPSTVTVGGLQGKQVTLTPPAHGPSCTRDGELVMTLPLGHLFALEHGQTMTLTALDDSGVLLIVEEETTPKETAQDRAQLAALLTSMSIGGSS